MARRQHDEYVAYVEPVAEEWIVADEERSNPLLDEACEGAVEAASGTSAQDNEVLLRGSERLEGAAPGWASQPVTAATPNSLTSTPASA